MLELRFSPHRFSIRGRAHRLSPLLIYESSGIVFTNPLDEFKGAPPTECSSTAVDSLSTWMVMDELDVFSAGSMLPMSFTEIWVAGVLKRKPLHNALALPGFPSRALTLDRPQRGWFSRFASHDRRGWHSRFYSTGRLAMDTGSRQCRTLARRRSRFHGFGGR